MSSESLLCQFLVFGAWLAIVGIRPDTDAATRSKDACYLNVFRVHQFDEILHDDVYAVFMEIAMIAETEEIKFQTLALYHLYVRNIADANLCEIWFLCKQYSAKEAEQMGMVNKVVPLEKLEDTCVEWAEIMMERSPLALRMIKAGLNAELDGQAGIQELAGDATMLYYTMDEAQEGGKAFLEKRKPRFEDYPQFP